MTWKPGDRVQVNPTMLQGDSVLGTVREVDPHGRPGVLVDLDRPIRGLSTCTATHAELRAVSTAVIPNRQETP
jgi:hypothetical protein